MQNEERTVVELETSMGTIKIGLFPDKAPITVKNFLDYVNNGFYNYTVFHRVIPGYVIQGGGHTQGMEQKQTGSTIKNEADNGFPNDRGTIAMARTRSIESATSQFFINLIDNQKLNHRDKTEEGFGYCVFGKVIDGLDVVDAIASVRTTNQGYYSDVPKTDVVIYSANQVE